MDALFAQQCNDGQRTNEELYGSRLRIFGVEIPCTHSEQRKNFQLVEGGRSCLNFIACLTFRLDALNSAREVLDPTSPLKTAVPEKGVPIELLPANGTEWLLMKLAEGMLLSDGLKFEFMAHDRNYAA